MSTQFNYIHVVLDITDADKEVPVAKTFLSCGDAIISTSIKAALEVCHSRAEQSPGRKYAVFSADSFVMASKPEPRVHMICKGYITPKKGPKQ